MDQSTIRINRDRDFFGIARKLKIYIDGKHVGGVRWKKSAEFLVSPTMHLLHVKMDWCESIPITPNLKKHELVEYRVLTPASSRGVVGLFKQLADLIFNSSDFYELKRIDR